MEPTTNGPPNTRTVAVFIQAPAQDPLGCSSCRPALDSAAGCSCGCRVPSSGAVVAVQRVRRRLQMSSLDSVAPLAATAGSGNSLIQCYFIRMHTILLAREHAYQKFSDSVELDSVDKRVGAGVGKRNEHGDVVIAIDKRQRWTHHRIVNVDRQPGSSVPSQEIGWLERTSAK